MSIDFEDFKQMAQTTSTAFEKIDWTKAAEELKKATKQMRDLEFRQLYVEQALREAAENAKSAAQEARDAAEIARVAEILKRRVMSKYNDDEFDAGAYVNYSFRQLNQDIANSKEEKSSKPKTSLDDVVEW